MAENILGKGENTGYQHFLLFPKCFQKAPSLGSGLCSKELNTIKPISQNQYSQNVQDIASLCNNPTFHSKNCHRIEFV